MRLRYRRIDKSRARFRSRRLILAIGGIATNDGGVGAAWVLGVSFRDASGRELGSVATPPPKRG